MAVFTDTFLYAVIVPVVPFSLTDRAGVPEDQVQHWVSVLLAIYGAALLVSAPIAGWYADNSSSRRVPLLFGLVALTGSTVMLCLAKSIGVLIVGRLLQGGAAGMMWTVGQALLVDTVGQRDIGQIMGYVSIAMSVGIIIAPLLGGIVYDRSGYYAVYYMCFGLLALDIVLRLVLIEKKIAAQWDDVEPSVTQRETGLEANNLEANIEDPDSASTHKGLNTPDVSSADSNLDLAPVLPAEPQTQPHLPASSKPHSKFPPVLTLLASRRLLAALWGCFIQSCLLTSFDSVLPLFVISTFSWGPTAAGLIFLPIMIPSFLAPLSGYLSDRYGPRWLAVCGFLSTIPCLVCLRFVDSNTIQQKVLLCALLALIGAALTAVMPPLMAEITYIVEAKEVATPGVFGAKGAYAQAYGLFVMAFAAGCLVGPIWSGFIATRSGWDTMTWTLAILSAAGAGPALVWTGGLVTRDNAKSGEERAVGRPKRRDGEREKEGEVEEEGEVV